MRDPFFLLKIICLIFLTSPAFSQSREVIDLHKLVLSDGIEVFNRELSLINEESHKGIRLSKDLGEGVAWLKNFEFSEGTIAFDVRGEDIKQHSFVGLAFYGKDSDTFDAIYLRPFQFNEQNETIRNHGIQYISLPDFSWRILREKFPDKYEHAVEPAPDPNSWVSVRIIIKGSVISTYINGNPEPSLVVGKLTNRNTGSIGFYVADTSGGDFANLIITKTQ